MNDDKGNGRLADRASGDRYPVIEGRAHPGTDRRRFLAGAATLTGGALLGTALDPGTPASAAHPGPGPKVLRTPEARFRGLPDYPFQPHYVTVDAGDGTGTKLRVHYLDERPADPARASRIPGAQHRRHPTITDAAHFVQEDKPKEFAAAINHFIHSTRT
jgi:hypothetical protein